MTRYFPLLKASIASFFLVVSVMLSASQSALADWRKDIGVFRIGIVTQDRSVEALDRLEPFKLAISEALDMDVEFFRASSAPKLIDALANERIEYAVLSASSYALAWVACECVEPIAIPSSMDSTDGYHTILIAAANGPKTLAEIPDSKLGVLSQGSVTGVPMLSYALAQQGITISNDDAQFISEDSGELALKSFAEGQTNALIGWSTMTGEQKTGFSRGTLRQLSENFSMPASSYRILWQSEQIPHRPHVIRKKLHGDAKKILLDTLRGMNDSDPVAYDSIERVYGGGFSAGRHERFKQLIDLIKTLDIEEPVATPEAKAGEMLEEDAETKTAEETLPLQ